MTPLLQVEWLSKFFGRRIGCKDMNFELSAGEEMGTVGESGSGKSTLLNCIAGHLPPDTGAVRFNTHTEGPKDTATMREPERRMRGRTARVCVHQHARDSLRMNVAAGGNAGERSMAVRARHSADTRATATDWLGRVEITEDRIDDWPSIFSGRIQQRLQIARNLVTEPMLFSRINPPEALMSARRPGLWTCCVVWSAR